MITIEAVIPLTELIDLLRAIPLKGDDQSLPYKEARFELRSVRADELNPASLYVLKDKLALISHIAAELAEYGQDVFSLTEGLVLRNGDQTWTMIPPIVEHIFELVLFSPCEEGELYYPSPTLVGVPIITDGLHRILMARRTGRNVNVIHISEHWSREHPFYAYPNHWDQVSVLDSVPRNSDKKRFRRADCYKLYRDLSALGCGSPRATGQKV